MSGDDRQAVGSFEVASMLTDKRTVKFSGYVYSDDTESDINLRVDRIQNVIDRQAVRSDLQNKEAQIAMHEANLGSIRENYEHLSTLVRAGNKLTSQQKAALDNFEPTVEQGMKQIASLKEAIAKGRQKINGIAHA